MAKTGKLFINGKDAWTTWGMTLESKALTALMTPAGMKENIKNASRNMHGTQVIKSNARLAARTVTMTVQITAKTKEAFLARYASFCEELKTGFLDIRTGYQPGVVYKMEYNSCTQFSEYVLEAAKFTLKLTENNPDDRS